MGASQKKKKKKPKKKLDLMAYIPFQQRTINCEEMTKGGGVYMGGYGLLGTVSYGKCVVGKGCLVSFVMQTPVSLQ